MPLVTSPILPYNGYPMSIQGLTATLKKELEITIETALMLAEEGTTIPALAERIYNSEPQLMGECQRLWALERIRWILYRKKQRIASKNQLRLPGFENLPRVITMKDGRRRVLKNATLDDLREYRTVLVNANNDRIEALDRLIALVSKYSKREKKRLITVEEVITAERKSQEG
jgi:hypothetical protein